MNEPSAPQADPAQVLVDALELIAISPVFSSVYLVKIAREALDTYRQGGRR